MENGLAQALYYAEKDGEKVYFGHCILYIPTTRAVCICLEAHAGTG
jgi:hypothetical protein